MAPVVVNSSANAKQLFELQKAANAAFFIFFFISRNLFLQ